MKVFNHKSKSFKELEKEINSCIDCGKSITFKFEQYQGLALPLCRCKKCQKDLDKIFPRRYDEYMKYLEGQK